MLQNNLEGITQSCENTHCVDSGIRKYRRVISGNNGEGEKLLDRVCFVYGRGTIH